MQGSQPHMLKQGCKQWKDHLQVFHRQFTILQGYEISKWTWLEVQIAQLAVLGYSRKTRKMSWETWHNLDNQRLPPYCDLEEY